jgi:hypothetical protein
MIRDLIIVKVLLLPGVICAVVLSLFKCLSSLERNPAAGGNFLLWPGEPPGATVDIVPPKDPVVPPITRLLLLPPYS